MEIVGTPGSDTLTGSPNLLVYRLGKLVQTTTVVSQFTAVSQGQANDDGVEFIQLAVIPTPSPYSAVWSAPAPVR